MTTWSKICQLAIKSISRKKKREIKYEKNSGNMDTYTNVRIKSDHNQIKIFLTPRRVFFRTKVLDGLKDKRKHINQLIVRTINRKSCVFYHHLTFCKQWTSNCYLFLNNILHILFAKAKRPNTARKEDKGWWLFNY